MAEDRSHSPLGASKAERWINCPGSVALCADIPEAPPSKFADEGTRAHKLAELELLAWRDGTRPANGYPADMVHHVRHYVQAVKDAHRAAGGGEVAIEQRFNLSHIGEGMFGTVDCAILGNDGCLYVFDLKYGAGVAVTTEHNPQLLYYAWGAHLANPKFDFDRICITVVQPRLAIDDKVVRPWDVDLLTFAEFGALLTQAAAKTREPNAPLAGGKWCRWCPKAPTCPLLLADVEWTETESAVPAEPTPAVLREMYDRAARAEHWIKSYRAYVLTLAMRGTSPAGMKLVRKRATRKWSEAVTADDIVTCVPTISRTEVIDERLLSPAQLQKIVGKDQMAKLVSLYDATEPGLTLALESDPRNAVAAGAASDFADIEMEVE